MDFLTSIGFAPQSALICAALFFALIVAQECGRRLGERRARLHPNSERPRYAGEGAVFAALSLFLAFAFQGAGARFDHRRDLIVEEANAISTAWLRLDLLPERDRPEIRVLMREYLDARLETYRLVSVGEPYETQAAAAGALQQRIWAKAVKSAEASGGTPPFTVLLPALNQMNDLATTRVAATRLHPPAAVYVMIGVMALVGSAFVGYSTADQKVRSWVHAAGFSGVIALALYVILDLEFPRLGFVRLDVADQVLVELRRSMD